MSTGLQLADHIVIVGYFVLLTVIGLYFWKRMKHIRDFFTGGNAIPWWLAGVSFYMTGFSAFTFVAYSEMAYRFGFVAITLAWSASVAMALGTIFLASRWRRARIISPVEFLEARYNRPVRQILAWAGLPLKIVDDGLKIFATGVFVSIGLGYDLKVSIIGCGVVMLLYTFMGGLWAVVVTDYIQFIILTLGVLVLFPLVIGQLGSLANFSATVPADFFWVSGGPFSWLYILAFYLLIALSYNGNWAMAQKFYCVRNESEARKAGILGALLMFLGPPLFILPAMAARSLMPELMQPPNSPQYTYAALTLKFLPAGLMGLMIAAMFSATMSTLSGDYNVMASVVTKDIYQRLFDKNASQRRLVLVGRIATLLIGTITIIIGVVLIATARRGLFEVMVTVFGLFVGPMLIPMLLGLLSSRFSWRSAVAGIVAGFTSGISLYSYKNFVLSGQPGIDPNWLRYDYEAISILVNFAVTAGAMMLVSFIERVSIQERAKIAEFFARLSVAIKEDDMAEQTKEEVFSPFYIIGWITIGTGLLLLIAVVGQPSSTAWVISMGAGLTLCVIGYGLYRMHLRFQRRSGSPPVAAEQPLDPVPTQASRL